MNRFTSFILAIMCWATAAFAEEPAAAVAGIVRSATTGEALHNAPVVLRSRDVEAKVFRSTTSASGGFGFSGLPPGRYQLTISKSGYETFQGDAAVNLREGTEGTRLALSLWPHAVLSGRVIDWEGEPVAQAQVHAYAVVYSATGVSLRLVARAETNDLGEYRVFDLPAGKYVVEASPPRTGTPSGQFYIDTPVSYYPSALAPAQASPIALNPGQEVTRADVTVARRPGYAIAGAVWDGLTEGPCRRCLVQAVQDDSLYRATLSRPASVSPDGAFVLRGLSPGDYILVARQGSAVAQVHASIRDQHLQGARLVTGLQQSVTGQMVLENAPEGTDPADLVPSLSPVALPEWWPRAEGKVGANRQFTIAGVSPARYRFEVRGLPPGAYLKTILAGGQPLPSPDITVPGESGITGLQLVIAFDGATLRGKVRPAGSAGKEQSVHAQVFLVPQQGPSGFQLPQTAETTLDGSFSLVSAAPGSYTLYALPAGASLQIFDPAVQAVLARDATNVRLDPKATVDLEVALASQGR
ncbi:MAG: carboxypeptidase regulatory-like domain-containing protein [Acidobacteria bacterium]|nr:carboxypeptidase regulatory-like domain-containing protein [Acidobacteriota bacterium]